MKKSYLMLLILIVLSCSNSKQKINISEHKEQIEIKKESQNKIGILEEKPNIATIELNDTSSIANVALKFINDYVKNCNKMREQVGIVEWVNAYPNVSQEFKTELTKMIQEAEENDPGYGLGFDPIFDAQDYPDDGFGLAEFDSISNYLTVKAKSWKGFTITMKIKELDKKWMVDGCGVINIPKTKQAKR
jgi:hypothetical protein